MIARHGSCFGLTLFRLGRWKVELWYAPADFATVPHRHNDSSGEFTVLYGRNRRIWRRVAERMESYIVNFPSCLGRFLSVRAGTVHGFDKGDSCMIWLCFETWRKGAKVTSVAEDFVTET